MGQLGCMLGVVSIRTTGCLLDVASLSVSGFSLHYRLAPNKGAPVLHRLDRQLRKDYALNHDS